MRILSQIPHPKFRIIVYQLEGKYLVEIEAGPMKQAYKLGEEVQGEAGVKAFLSPAFLDEVHDIFNTMYTQMQKALKG